MIKAALYTRVSTTRQDAENQVPVLEAMAAARGYQVVKVYEDVVSGAKVGADKRKQFPQMMEAARRGEFQVLLVFSIDRLTRKGGMDAIKIVVQLAEYGVKVASHTQSWLDPKSEFYATMLAMAGDLAAIERNTLVQRTLAGLAKARKQGRVGGRPTVVVDRDKVKARYSAGESQPVIAADLGISVMTVNRIVRAA